jgi:hypothetical protein
MQRFVATVQVPRKPVPWRESTAGLEGNAKAGSETRERSRRWVGRCIEVIQGWVWMGVRIRWRGLWKAKGNPEVWEGNFEIREKKLGPGSITFQSGQ